MPIRLLAPMEGLTDPVMRQILTQIAVDLCSDDGKANDGIGYNWSVSEFIRINQHLLPEHVFYKHIPELHTDSKTQAGTLIHAQLLGSDPQLMAENACRVAEMGSNNHRGGSVLLDEPKLMRDIISAVRLAVPSHIPVSAKIRLGYENTDNMDDIRQAIADSGANWLTIHARTKKQGYKPPAYWEKIARFTDLDIPIIANGEIWNHQHAMQCIEQSGTPHLMLGRGAVTRPDLIAQVNNPQIELTWEQLIPPQVAFLQGEFRSEKALVGRYKQWLGMLTRGYPEALSIWSVVKKEREIEKIIDILQGSVANGLTK